MNKSYNKFGADKTVYNGIKFRSSFEADVARAFDKHGIQWEYEPITITLIPKFKFMGRSVSERTYTPDFLVENHFIVEIKGYEPADWSLKLTLFKKHYLETNETRPYLMVKRTLKKRHQPYEVTLKQLLEIINNYKSQNNE